MRGPSIRTDATPPSGPIGDRSTTGSSAATLAPSVAGVDNLGRATVDREITEIWFPFLPASSPSAVMPEGAVVSPIIGTEGNVFANCFFSH